MTVFRKVDEWGWEDFPLRLWVSDSGNKAELQAQRGGQIIRLVSLEDHVLTIHNDLMGEAGLVWRQK